MGRESRANKSSQFARQVRKLNKEQLEIAKSTRQIMLKLKRNDKRTSK